MKDEGKVIGSGAEAIIYHKGARVIKHRQKKNYRHHVIDSELRENRTRREAKILRKACVIGLRVPRVLGEKASEGVLEIEHVKGKKLRDVLDEEVGKGVSAKVLEYCKKVGEGIALLHKHGIIHGDLTTSNFIVTRENKVFFIDFGLSFHSLRLEDKAVDLHLLKQALESRHWLNAKKFFKAVLEGYGETVGKHKTKRVLVQLNEVESRGRYKGKERREVKRNKNWG